MEQLEEKVIRLCKEKRWTISTAESCTGGLVGATLVNVSGASDVFEMGFITYANRAKVSCVHVSEFTLEKHGAVSQECALEMAAGCRMVSGCDIGISTTGIAGPTGGTEEKPVGLVYIAVAGPDGTQVKKNHFLGNREEVREQTVAVALQMTIDLLEQSKDEDQWQK